MKPFEPIDAVAIPFDSPNVDTDQIAPARFLRRPREEGYERFLFHDLRFDQNGRPISTFIMNQPVYADARILVVGRNFGGGSSREQAVWCLVDYGIRCVIGSSFGDIFYNNSVNHGLLLIRESEQRCRALREQLHAKPGARVQVDLQSQSYTWPDASIHSFEIEANRKKRLLHGLDEIGLTLQHEDEISDFENRFEASHPWLFSVK